MDAKDVLVAEAGVLFRSMIVALVGYGAWTAVAGGAFSWETCATVAAALFVIANVVYAVAAVSRPDVLALARSIEDRL